MLVARFAVIGQLAPDGAVELVQLDLDLKLEPRGRHGPPLPVVSRS
jgi:hypothetical protein